MAVRVHLTTAIALYVICLLTTQVGAWGVVQFHGSRNCSSDTVSFARLCSANKCCTAISYSPADQTQSAIGAKGNCANGRVTGKLYAAHGAPPPLRQLPLLHPYSSLNYFADCSGQVLSSFDVEELTSDDIQSARCSFVGTHDSAMGDCSGGDSLCASWKTFALLLLFLFSH